MVLHPMSFPAQPAPEDGPSAVPHLLPHPSYLQPPEEDSFFGPYGLWVLKLAEAVQAEVPTRVGEDGRLYAYVDGHYIDEEKVSAVKMVAARLLGHRFRQPYIKEVVARLRLDPRTLPMSPDPDVFNLTNGLLDWRTGELYPHTPGHPSTIRIPVTWDPTVDCPRIRRFLGDVLPADAIGFAEELTGYTLFPGNPFRHGVLAHGAGGNGKSTWLGVLQALLGSDNYAVVSLHTLQENRFAVADLAGQLAAVCGDLDARGVRSSDVFKQLTGGDPMRAERKHGQPFTFIPMALPIFSANALPTTTDQSLAWFDRWLVVPFERRFVGHGADQPADPHLLAKLTTPEELSGLLNLAVAGLRRVMTRGRFAIPPSIQRATAAYRAEVDTVRRFVADDCVLDPGAWTSRKDLRSAYEQWCSREGLTPQKATDLYARLDREWPGQIEVARHADGRGFNGLRVLDR